MNTNLHRFEGKSDAYSETPNPNTQAPEKLQAPNFKAPGAWRIWCLVIGASLVIGGWCLGLCRPDRLNASTI
jgi:hypothetical protein